MNEETKIDDIIIEKKSFNENVNDFMNVGDNLTEAVYHAHDIEIFYLIKDILSDKPKLLTNGK